MESRKRKSPFVKLFDKTPEEVMCPHFYELILSNGCPYNCDYCYLKLTFRGKTSPVLFDNDWKDVEKELEKVSEGVFSTGELADSLAVLPPLLEPAIKYFRDTAGKRLLLLTKSDNINQFKKMEPSNNIIISFSLNSMSAWKSYEKGTPSPMKRLSAARELKDKGWRVRIRLDPVILQSGLEDYREMCVLIHELAPETVTVGTLRQFPGVHRYNKMAPREGLSRASDGRMRYPQDVRINAYMQLADWLGDQPSLCKETHSVWGELGWTFTGCNCTD